LRYNKTIIIVETDYPFTVDENDGLEYIFGSKSRAGIPQHRKVIEYIGSYFERHSNITKGVFFDCGNRILPAMKVFNQP
jgi:arabinogalactan endo-1,4-beta-galactosidase